MSKSKSFFDAATNAVVWEINGFVSFDEFKEVGEESHKLRRKHGVRKQLNNIESMKVLSKDIQNYIDEVWFPAAKATRLDKFAFVVPNDTFGKVSMDAVNADAKEKYGIDIKYFTEESLAKSWLASN